MDQIADLLVRIKNASLSHKETVSISHSKMKAAILTILANEGFISDFEILKDGQKSSLVITMGTKRSLSHLKQLSTPGRRLYAKSKEIPSPLRGLGTVIVSTSGGLTTGREAKKIGVGGELICEIW